MSDGALCGERHPITRARCVQKAGHEGVVCVTGDAVQFRRGEVRAAVRFAKRYGNRAIRRGDGMPLSAFTRRKSRKSRK